MAIHLTPEENSRLYKIVRNYNQKVIRANKEGKIRKDRLPEQASIYALKRNYSSRDKLERELQNLEQFRRKDVREKFSVGLDKYEEFLVKNNRADALEFYQHRYETLSKVAKPYSLTDTNRLALYSDYIKALSKDMESSSDDDLRLMERGIHNYRMAYNKQGAGYRGFLEEVDWIMDNVGIPQEQQDEFFNKLKKLTPEEFYDIYVESDLVQSIYDLVDSPTDSETKMYGTKRDAKKKINRLLSEIDIMIADIKKRNKDSK